MKTRNGEKLGGGFDLIGDIHGHAAPLRRLLTKLGYEEIDGCYRHPNRRVIFLGDFIDRGPAIRESLRIVRAMIDQDAALAVMGNHEFNALCYHTTDEAGVPLRANSPKNRIQHQATLDAFADYPGEWRDYLDWFLTLPLYLEMPGFRVVHATWDAEHIATLGTRDRLDESSLHKAARRGTPEFQAVDVLLKGMEIPLPDGQKIPDRHGQLRCEIRTRWWLTAQGRTYRDLILPSDDTVPALPVSPDQAGKLTGYAADAPPVFVGHYWLPPEHPKSPLAPNVVCLDYSVAKGGPLVAYCWDGEGALSAERFVEAN